MNRLVLVRHAESLANTIGSLDCEVPGPGLSDRGVEQARALVTALAADIGDRPVRAVWASTMLRAQQTAEPLAEHFGVPVQVHPLLHEGHIGDLHARVDDEAHQALDDLLAYWQVEEELDHCRPGGETGTGLVERVFRALSDVVAGLGSDVGPDGGSDGGAEGDSDGGAAVVVSHGAILRVGLPRICDGLTPRYTLAHHLPNTGRVVVDVVDPEGPALRCRTWNGLTPTDSP